MSLIKQIKQFINGSWQEFILADNNINLNLVNGEGVHSLIQVTNHYANEDGTNDWLNEATGSDAIALGIGSKATNSRAVAIGNRCNAEGNTAFVIGQTNTAKGSAVFMGGINNFSDEKTHYSLIFGENNQVTNNSNMNMVLGENNTLSDNLFGGTVFGNGNTVKGGEDGTFSYHNLVFGDTNTASLANYSTFIGKANTGTKTYGSTFVGYGNKKLDEVGSNYGFLVGFENSISGTGDNKYAFGYQNIISSQNGFALGFNNNISNQAFALGRGNTVSGNAATAIGTGHECSGYGSTALGYKNKSTDVYSTVIGLMNESSGEASTVVGQYNTKVENALFVVGNGKGTADTERANAFEVLKDGRAKIFGAPTEENDVVRKKELDEAVAIILDDEGATAAIDSFKELQDLLGSDTTGASGLINQVNENTEKINNIAVASDIATIFE